VDEFKKTPLHISGEKGFLDVVQFLEKNGANCSIKPPNCQLNIHEAVRNGKLADVVYLLSTRIDINMRNDKFSTYNFLNLLFILLLKFAI